ncbi:MAG TPA: hypothetical protein DCE78_03610 [Bacteroidetes bacterium]|nr:hypothetical protein [Bacteroidota bacterium]
MTKITLKYGIIYALASLIWLSLEFFLGFQTTYAEMQQIFTLIFLIPAFYIMYRGMKAHRDIFHENQAPYSYLVAFLTGFYIAVIATLLSPTVSYIFHSFVNPDFFETMIRESVSSMRMTEEMAREYFNHRSFIQQGIVGGLISGTIMSAILSFFLMDKKRT